MSRLRIVLGLVGMLSVFATTAAPTMAWFQGATASRGTFTTGPLMVLAVPCENAEGGWEVWSQTETKVATKITQATVTVGPHELVTISKWNHCGAFFEHANFVVEITPCAFQLKQPSKAQTTGITADVASECRITFDDCTIKLPQANNGVNEMLGKLSLENSGANLVQNAETLTGISGNTNKVCKLGGIESFEGTGTLKAVFTAVGQKEV